MAEPSSLWRNCLTLLLKKAFRKNTEAESKVHWLVNLKIGICVDFFFCQPWFSLSDSIPHWGLLSYPFCSFFDWASACTGHHTKATFAVSYSYQWTRTSAGPWALYLDLWRKERDRCHWTFQPRLSESLTCLWTTKRKTKHLYILQPVNI